MPISRSLLPVSALLVLALPAFPDTLIIDDDGGAGVDFTQISAAAAAAQDGDVLCIGAGSYNNFFIDGKGLTLIGEAGATVNGDCIISNLAAQQSFTITSLGNLSIWFDDCAGRIVLDDVTTGVTCCAAPILFTQCADARVQRSTFVGDALQPSNDIVEGIFAEDSRIEIVSCTLIGQDGGDPFLTSSPRGAAALGADSSRVHIAQSALRGGDAQMSFGCSPSPGSGGPGVSGVGSGTEIILAGTPARIVQGGDGGASPQNQCDGLGASAVELFFSNGTLLRTSGLSLQGGAHPAGGTADPITPGTGTILVQPNELDPTVELLTTPVPGQTVEVRITGEPGSSVTLFAARDAALIPDPQSEIEQLTTETRALTLGLIPPAGELTRTFLMPAAAPIGTSYWVQAATLSPSGDFERSNSAALILR